ncbi:4-hydroxy-3-methylbut-2-enyl diphosphate reductase [Streptomyces sp. NPDC087908]|uniref:4-hydroxy-3-methylbut-2-enyl diphosphate reductase n=1 Tax=Streptomyces sp. NPDC087908 TaxID=3365820 RepID=UPI00382A471B
MNDNSTCPDGMAADGAVSVGRRVLLAAPRGWCAGVDRAVVAVEESLRRFGAPIFVRHEIVHNAFVVESLKRQGAVFVEDTADVPEGSILILSAHGVAPQIHQEAADRNVITVDATCPLVTKVHREAGRFADEDIEIVLIGHEGHEEVVGTLGQAPGHTTLVEGPDDVAALEVRDPGKVAWLSQTTLSVDETTRTVAALRARFPALISPPSDDICYATQNRQNAVKQIASMSDLVLVVGSSNSSNTVRLVEVAETAGVGLAQRIDGVADIDESWLADVSVIGVTAGASAPESIVVEVLAWLAARGYADVQTVETAQETTVFSLPHELRRDLRGEAAAGASRRAETEGTRPEAVERDVP